MRRTAGVCGGGRVRTGKRGRRWRGASRPAGLCTHTGACEPLQRGGRNAAGSGLRHVRRPSPRDHRPLCPHRSTVPATEPAHPNQSSSCSLAALTNWAICSALPSPRSYIRDAASPDRDLPLPRLPPARSPRRLSHVHGPLKPTLTPVSAIARRENSCSSDSFTLPHHGLRVRQLDQVPRRPRILLQYASPRPRPLRSAHLLSFWHTGTHFWGPVRDWLPKTPSV